MVEPVRLIIWDLDETFWRGTLTEGGIVYRDDTHDLVIELARRGIMSSICSKNDLEPVQALLTEKGIWDYFIFPSINWDPKGSRIANIIELIQLRPSTILFIDDNPMNLNEALHYTADLQTAPETFIPEILGSALFTGKDDKALSRLAQYKLLEKRKADETSAGSDNSAFLRASNVRVIIDHDIEANIDRAVELINRTNQLNFTKLRLSENLSIARDELRASINNFRVQAGLVRVIDSYGDYGYCGIYVINRAAGRDNERANLIHFAFSCRILNMGVENWLYQHLGRPRLKVSGEVLTDVIGDKRDIDWISLQTAGLDFAHSQASKTLEHELLHGGCDLNAVMHYFCGSAKEVTGEFHAPRDGLTVRADHSIFLRYALDELGPEGSEAAERLGFPQEIFKTRIHEISGPKTISILSLLADAMVPLYRHRSQEIYLPFWNLPIPQGYRGCRYTEIPSSALDQKWQGHWIADALDYLRDNFIYYGISSEPLFKSNLERILSSTEHQEKCFILLGNDVRRADEGVKPGSYKAVADINRWTQEVSGNFSNVELISIRDFIETVSEIHSQSHFDRMIYFRLYKNIMKYFSKSDQGLAA